MRQLPDLLERLYDAASDAKGWNAFVEALDLALPGSATLLHLPFPTLEHRGGLVAPSIERALLERYDDHYRALDPFEAAIRRLPTGSVSLADALVSDAELSRSAVHREWLAPQGLRPSLVALIDRSESGRATTLRVFWRDRAHRRRAALALVEALIPHLGRALRIHLETGQLRAERSALSAVLDRLPLGLVLIDRQSRVVARNRSAERLLARCDGLALSRDGLRAATPCATAELRHSLQRVSAAPRGDGSPLRALTLGRPSGLRPLDVLLVAMPSHDVSDPPGRPVVALLVGDPEAEVSLRPETLVHLLGLTPAEAALAGELAGGRNLHQAALALGITRETARSRLRDIFGKTGTRRQASLVGRLLSSPAVFDFGA